MISFPKGNVLKYAADWVLRVPKSYSVAFPLQVLFAHSRGMNLPPMVIWEKDTVLTETSGRDRIISSSKQLWNRCYIHHCPSRKVRVALSSLNAMSSPDPPELIFGFTINHSRIST